jgi:hypothetical protein
MTTTTTTAAGRPPSESTQRAQQDTILSPRFYTTHFKAMDRINVEPIRAEFEALMAQFEADANSDHFQRPSGLNKDHSQLPPGLYQEFVDFMISSVTERWCNDEFRHGEAFALLMRAEPHLMRGLNKLWIKFFVLAVFATMYVRDHSRPVLFEAMGMVPTEYDFTVFRITSDITRQVFPLTVSLDDPRFKACLDKLLDLNSRVEKAKAQGGVIGTIKRIGLSANAAFTFARLYFLPTRSNELPKDVRMVPAW